jgi:hypothetical protein
MRRVSPVQKAHLRLLSAQRLYASAMAQYQMGDERANRRLSKAAFLLDLARERLSRTAKSALTSGS